MLRFAGDARGLPGARAANGLGKPGDERADPGWHVIGARIGGRPDAVNDR